MTDRTQGTVPDAATVPVQGTGTDAAVVARQRAAWALGDYPTLARELLAPLGPVMVAWCDIEAGQRVLDVGAGSGTVAITAARTGATVTACDLTPELLDAGRRTAEERGLAVTWDVADAQALPYADASFDAVVSSMGAMFAPDHARAAEELLRVCKRGGRIGLLSWTPHSFMGEVLTAIRHQLRSTPGAAPWDAEPFDAEPPPEAWGDEAHVSVLLGDRVLGVRSERRALRVGRFDRPEDFLDYFKTRHGPTIAAYSALEDRPDAARGLDRELRRLASQHVTGDGAMAWEYLLLTAVRR